MKHKKQRQSRPKRLRFSRFFLRRLIPCLLAAGTVCIIRIRSSYKYWEDFDKYAKEDLEDKLDIFDEEGYFFDAEGHTWADEIMQSGGLPAVLRNLTNQHNMLSELPFQPYKDISAMLIQPDTGKYVISEPQVRLYACEYGENGETQNRAYTADTAQSEQISDELLAYAQQHSFRFGFWTQFFGKSYLFYALTEFEPFEMLIGRYYPYMFATHAYVNGDQLAGVEYGWNRNIKQLHDITFFGNVPSGEWQEITNHNFYRIGDTYYRDKANWYKDRAPGVTDLNSIYFSGYPANCPSGQLMRRSADQISGSWAMYQKQVAHYQEIIDDPTGKLRQKYYREQFDLIVMQMQDEDETKRRGEQVYSEVQAKVPSPEEKIEELNKEWISKPRGIVWNTLNYDTFGYEPSRYQFYIDSREVTLKGKNYILLSAQSVDVKNTVRPGNIIESFQAFLAAVLLALLWATIARLKALRKYEKDEYRRSLTAALAHDLKSPLTAISGYAENLDSGVHPEKQKHYTASILENSQYMDSIITNVLELSRLEQDSVAKRKWVELITLAKDQLSYREDEIADRELQIQVTGCCFLYADPQMMAQAVCNLLDNAFKYTPDGGSITVTGEECALRVVNDIKEEKVNRIDELCEAFVKGDSARSNRKGTGLGLSVVTQAAKLNKLRFSIESSGHSFTALLSDKPLLFRRIRMQKKKQK